MSAFALLVALPACKSDDPNSTATEEESSADSGIDGTAESTAESTASTTDTTTSTTDTTGDGDGDGDGDTTTTTTTTGGGVGACPVDGKLYACGDGLDNDDDGLVDDADPECTGPCDDDEGTFATGIPGDNMDCTQDCFFDGNSGQGGGDCKWDLKCDPENPGANIGCAYTGGNNCDSKPPDTPDTCVATCGALTPNNCDCFGCCIVSTPSGDVNIFLGSGGNCSLSNIDECQTCTIVEDCLNPCVPDDCELCFGEDQLPEGCDDPKCPEGQDPCVDDGNPETPSCPEGLFCQTGCCVDWAPPD